MIYKLVVLVHAVLLLVFAYNLLKQRWFPCFVIAFAILATCGPTEALVENPITRVLRDIPFVVLAVAMWFSGDLKGTASNWRSSILGLLLILFGLLMLLMLFHPGNYGMIPALADLRYHLVAPVCFFIARALARETPLKRILFWLFPPLLLSALVGFTQLNWTKADYAAALGARYASLSGPEYVNLLPMGLSESFLFNYLPFPILYTVWIALTRHDVSRRTRCFAFGAFFVLMVEAIILRSRTALVGEILACGVVVLCTARLRRSIAAPVLMLGLVAVVIVGGWGSIARLSPGVSMEKVNTLVSVSPGELIESERGRHWARGVDYVKRYPLGAGLGHSPTTWRYFQGHPGAPPEPVFRHVQFESSVVTGGLIGLAITVLIFGNACYFSYDRLRRGMTIEVRELAVLSLAFSVFVVLVSVGWSPLSNPALVPYFWTLLGGLIGTEERSVRTMRRLTVARSQTPAGATSVRPPADYAVTPNR